MFRVNKEIELKMLLFLFGKYMILRQNSKHEKDDIIPNYGKISTLSLLKEANLSETKLFSSIMGSKIFFIEKYVMHNIVH